MRYALCALVLLALDSAIRNPCLPAGRRIPNSALKYASFFMDDTKSQFFKPQSPRPGSDPSPAYLSCFKSYVHSVVPSVSGHFPSLLCPLV